MQIINRIKLLLVNVKILGILRLIMLFSVFDDNFCLSCSQAKKNIKYINELNNEKIFNNDIVIGNKNAKVIIIEYFAPT